MVHGLEDGVRGVVTPQAERVAGFGEGVEVVGVDHEAEFGGKAKEGDHRGCRLW